MYVLEIKNLSFDYQNQQILKDINLTLKSKDFLAVIGPNGGGKSTLLKLILGILKPKSGEIKIFSKSSKQMLKSVGYVPQNTNVNLEFPITVIDVVTLSSKKDLKKAQKWLERLNILHIRDKKIGSLSGGELQRVMIARALYNDPKILLLDEPTSHLDPLSQKSIYNLLKELSQNIAVMVVSHDISIVLEYAKKVAYINTNLVLHNMSENKKKLNLKDNHFCEVELMQMMQRCKC